MHVYTLALVAAVLAVCGEASKPFKTAVHGHRHRHTTANNGTGAPKTLSRRTTEFNTATNG